MHWDVEHHQSRERGVVSSPRPAFPDVQLGSGVLGEALNLGDVGPESSSPC